MEMMSALTSLIFAEWSRLRFTVCSMWVALTVDVSWVVQELRIRAAVAARANPVALIFKACLALILCTVVVLSMGNFFSCFMIPVWCALLSGENDSLAFDLSCFKL